MGTVHSQRLWHAPCPCDVGEDEGYHEPSARCLAQCPEQSANINSPENHRSTRRQYHHRPDQHSPVRSSAHPRLLSTDTRLTPKFPL